MEYDRGTEEHKIEGACRAGTDRQTGFLGARKQQRKELDHTTDWGTQEHTE